MLGESMAAKLWTWFTKAETSGPLVSPFRTLAAVGFCKMPWLKVLRIGVMSAVICLTCKITLPMKTPLLVAPVMGYSMLEDCSIPQ